MRSIRFAVDYSIQGPLSFSIVGCIVLCFFACQQEKAKENVLLGKWQVVNAVRDGKLTRTLEDGYFDFVSDTSFITNIYSSAETFKYDLTPEGFTQKGSYDVVYIIENEPRDTLILSAVIRNFEFYFMAVRDSTSTVLPEVE